MAEDAVLAIRSLAVALHSRRSQVGDMFREQSARHAVQQSAPASSASLQPQSPL